MELREDVDYQCPWETDELTTKLMEVIGEIHMGRIDEVRLYQILKDQIKDGSIFMNKFYPEPQLCLRKHANVDAIVEATKQFYEMTNDLSRRSIRYVNFDWCFYRAAPFGKAVGETIVAPVPFSVTSYFHLVPNWLSFGESCCLYKILIPGDTHFAILESIYTEELRAGMTEDEWELYEAEAALPPGVMTVISEETLHFVEEGGGKEDIRYLTCTFMPYSLLQAINKLESLPMCEQEE